MQEMRDQMGKETEVRTVAENAADRLSARIRSKIRPEWKRAFLTAFVVGMLTHLYMFTNNLLTWDSMFSLYAPQEMTGIGRPFLRYLCAVSSDFNLPLVLGTLSVCYLGLTAAALVECFGIRSRIYGMLVAALVVTFPVVSGTFCYLFTADGYMFAFFLSVLSVILAEKGCVGEWKKGCPWVIAGALTLAVSLGIYQAYFAVTITLCCLKLLLFLLKEDWKKIRSFAGAYLGMGMAGYVFYLLAVRLFRLWKGVGLLSYNGVDRLDHFVLSDVPRGIYTAYRQFFSFALRSNVLTTNGFMTFCVIALLVFGVCSYLYRLFQYKKGFLFRLIAAVVLVLLLPVGATIFCVMSPDVFIYILLRMPWVLFFLFVLELAEQSGTRAAVQLATAGLTVCMVFQFYLVSNIVYYNMNEKYEKSYALCVRLADRIEQQEGYYPWIRTLFVGAKPDDAKYPSTEVTTDVLSGYYPARSDFFLNSTDKYAEFFSHYLSISLAPVSDEEEEDFLQRDDVKNMDTFPAEDSVQIIDGILVVKMSDF